MIDNNLSKISIITDTNFKNSNIFGIKSTNIIDTTKLLKSPFKFWVFNVFVGCHEKSCSDKLSHYDV